MVHWGPAGATVTAAIKLITRASESRAQSDTLTAVRYHGCFTTVLYCPYSEQFRPAVVRGIRRLDREAVLPDSGCVLVSRDLKTYIGRGP
jgi:hypothetical protein